MSADQAVRPPDETSPVRLKDWVRAKWSAALEWKDGLPDKGRALRMGAFVVALLIAIAFLLLINWMLRGGGLWGDLAFALVITTLAFWILVRLVNFLLRQKENEVKALPRALAATMFVLVGVPITLVNWLAGLIFLFVPLLVAIVLVFTSRYKGRPKTAPALWKVTLASIGLLILFLLFQKPLTPEDLVPEAIPVPRAAAEGSDAQLAAAFRPLLFFDSGERRYPLDIDDAIADNRIDQCRKYLIADNCPDVTNAEEIDQSFDYLDIDESGTPPRGGGDESAVYYHVVRGDERVFVDYWWFYSRNPSPVADKVFCGPGFRTPPFTCQEHAGDWEGITVVIAPCEEVSDSCVDVGGELWGPTAVRYAQHAHLLSYSWERTLERVWESLGSPRADALAEIWDSLVLPAVEENGVRPVVFVARNSHASYPDPCFSSSCKQEVGGLPEARYDGGLPWSHNETCDGCLRRIPIGEEGEPALWNAFPGHWGSQECILAGAYCDLSQAPRGPSFQGRYTDPANDGEWICGEERDGSVRLAPCGAAEARE
jgi:hypothetical protein